jgi:hypothetical protein
MRPSVHANAGAEPVESVIAGALQSKIHPTALASIEVGQHQRQRTSDRAGDADVRCGLIQGPGWP